MPKTSFVKSLLFFECPLVYHNKPIMDETMHTPIQQTAFFGATDWDRTSNLRLRRPTLYPIELQSQTCALIIGAFNYDCRLIHFWRHPKRAFDNELRNIHYPAFTVKCMKTCSMSLPERKPLCHQLPLHIIGHDNL